MQDTLAGEKVFLRRASGLIKSASTWDVFIFNTGLVSVGIGIANMLLFAGYIYPGASIGWASLIAGLCMLAIGLGLVSWTITLPRSGGVYVFGTRSLWPPLAFTLSFVEVAAWCYYTSLGASWLISIGIGPGLSTLGVLQGSEALLASGTAVSKPIWVFIGGTIFLCLSGWLLIKGMRNYFISQKIIFTIAVAGSLLLTIILIFSDTTGFIQNFNKYMTPYFPGIADPYNHIIEAAKSAGWKSGAGTFDGWQTYIFSSWPFMPFIGAAFSIAIGGEIRSGGRGQFVGIIFAILVCIVAFVGIGELSEAVFGEEFLGAVSYCYYEGVKGAMIPSQPWITFLIAMLTGNSLITLFINLSFMCWIWMWIPGMHCYAERVFIAWSFDRVSPDALGYVSERTHTPVNAIIVSVIVTIILLALYLFTPYFATVIMIQAAAAAWFVVLVAGIFFPYRKKAMYEKSPISHKKILGFPIQSVACLLGSIGAAIAFHFMWSDNFSAGHNPYSLSVMCGWFVLGFIFYWIMYTFRKSQGIDVNVAFKEIPIE